ncbi:hypothetical protein IOCL2690_000081100, partial [Leishmania lindenbergi]
MGNAFFSSLLSTAKRVPLPAFTNTNAVPRVFLTLCLSVRRSSAATLGRRVLGRPPYSGHATELGIVALVLLILTAHVTYNVRYILSTDDSLDHLVNLQDPERGPWSVLVQHEGAVDRLSKVILVEEWLARCSSRGTPVTECNEPLLLLPHMLPAWTLHVVEEGCADCTDQQTYASAVEGVVLQARHAVFATSAAPLGRVGPMLLAMASVTDDVDVRAELPQWEWLRHVHGSG